MKTIREEDIGKATLRVVPVGKSFGGVVILDGKVKTRIDGDDPEEIWEKLLIEAARSSPDYFGFSGARNRFLKFFPEGFSSADYLGSERKYKVEAKKQLDETVPLEAAVEGSGHGDAIKAVFNKTNLLSQFELMRLKEALQSAEADQFIRGAAKMAHGNVRVGLQEMEHALKPHDAAKWTVVTYLPFLWQPTDHMFLKPETTKNFAERVGHPFYNDYETQLNADVYESLLNLAETTELETAELHPQDRIDVQSFIWVVGNYDLENDMPDSQR